MHLRVELRVYIPMFTAIVIECSRPQRSKTRMPVEMNSYSQKDHGLSVGYRAQKYGVHRATVSAHPAVQHRRCEIPVSGFYEWRGRKSARVPHAIFGPEKTLTFAGLM